MDKLKKAQKDELYKSFEEIKAIPMPTRWLKNEEPLAKISGNDKKSNKNIDICETADVKDVVIKYNEKLISPLLIKKLGDSNWKARKEGLNEIENILDSSNTRIFPTGLETLVKSMIARINDPNKSIVRQSLLLSGKFAIALGSESKIYAKLFLPAIITCLADKQNLLRQDAMKAINM